MKTVVSTPGSLLDTLQLLVPGASKRTLRQMMAQDRVGVNGVACRKATHPIQSGDLIEIGPRKPPPKLPSDLKILFEDSAILVIDKPTGLLSVATPDEREQTAYAYLGKYLKAQNPRQKLYIVHRLDRYASGVLVFAKTEVVQSRLKELFSEHDIQRNYWAIVEGRVERDRSTIRSNLVEEKSFYVHSVRNKKLGKPSVTHYRVIRRFPEYSALEVTLETGRKNQIRVHLSEVGHPIVGDRIYGGAKDPLGRLGLHAFHLGFIHPIQGVPVEFTTEPPPEFIRYLPR